MQGPEIMFCLISRVIIRGSMPSTAMHGNSNSISATHVWLILSKATHAIEENARRNVTGLGLGLSEFAALEVLLHKGPLPVNVIGKKVLLTSGAITTAVDRLETKDLVRRTADSQDRRSS